MKVFNWRLWLSEDFESEEIGVTMKTSIFMRGIWSVKTFVFVVSFSSSSVIGNTVLLKGVEVILRKLISKWCSSQNPTPTQSFEWSHWKSYTSSVDFFSNRDEDLLVSEEFVLTEELGIHQCELPTHEEHDIPEDFGSQNSDRCCATRQLSKISYHLTVISLKGIYVLSCRAAP